MACLTLHKNQAANIRPKFHLTLLNQNTTSWSQVHGNILHHFYVNKIRFWLISLMFPLRHGTSSASKRAQSSASVALHWSGFYSSSFSIFAPTAEPSIPRAAAGRGLLTLLIFLFFLILHGLCHAQWHASGQFVSKKCVSPCGISAHLQQPQPEACFQAEAPPAGVWPSACKRPFWQRKYPQPATGIAWMSYPTSSLKKIKKKRNLPN